MVGHLSWCGKKFNVTIFLDTLKYDKCQNLHDGSTHLALPIHTTSGRQHQGMDMPGVRQVPEGSGEQGKMEETGCEIIRGAPAITLAVKG